MNPLLLGPLFEIGKSIIERVLPDPAQKAQAELELLKMAQQGDLAALDAEMRLALGQLDINKAEAATDAYRGGWRPFCGWICGAGLGYTFLLRPLLPWTVSLFGADVQPMPAIDTDTLMLLLTGMLGLGGLRTFERVRGKA